MYIRDSIQVPPAQCVALMEAFTASDLAARIRNAGFDYVSVDAEGYLSGSLNRAIE